MKVLMKPVKMIAMNEESGVITPIRFKMENKELGYITIKIDNIILRSEEKLAGNRMLIFRCQSDLHGLLYDFELKYEVSTCKWFLYKM
jgi:F420-dependent methylenetetrahydromethanopterin dehydrogenase